MPWRQRVIHDYGHWMPEGVVECRALQLTGASWKFANYADQVLRAKLRDAGGW